MTAIDTKETVSRICEIEFSETPENVTVMQNAYCNTVVAATVGYRDLIFRFNSEPRFIRGSHSHIPLLRSRGIIVPEILAQDLSKTAVPVAYQIQTRIPGTDIGRVIETLTDTEIQSIANEIASIFTKLRTITPEGMFGLRWGNESQMLDSWAGEIERVITTVSHWGKKTGVLDDQIQSVFSRILGDFRPYFDTISPTVYLGDIAENNVMVENGRFSGLVDLDCLSQGDPLEAVGRIKAAWHGTRHGDIYATALMDALDSSSDDHRIVTMYALLNRCFTTLANGIAFKGSVSKGVDHDRVTKEKAQIARLYAELYPNPSTTPVLNTAAEQKTEQKPREATAVPQVRETEIPRIEESENHIVPLIEVSGVSKTYISDGIGFNALNGVDLRIAKGDSIAIVGKSGSGKSTLMHMLACLDDPTEGYVYIDRDDTTNMTESQKNMLRNEKFGFVFQQFFLNGRDTVFENVVMPLRIRGANDYELSDNADRALAAVGLSDKKDKKAKDLSGGEKQRVCIARALVGQPEVVFADEPTGNLDSVNGESVERLLFNLNELHGITLIIVTHDFDLARKCRRIVEMKDGRIISDRRTGGGVA